MSNKAFKERSNKKLIIMDKDKSFIDKILGDISKTSASQQIILGSVSGWISGFLCMRVGKVIAVSVGGGIILLQIANEMGYIKVNWNKLNRQLDKVSDKVEQKITGEGPSWLDKAERFVERKVDKAADELNKTKKKANKWYNSDSQCRLKKIHIFAVSFVAGAAIGIACS